MIIKVLYIFNSSITTYKSVMDTSLTAKFYMVKSDAEFYLQLYFRLSRSQIMAICLMSLRSSKLVGDNFYIVFISYISLPVDPVYFKLYHHNHIRKLYPDLFKD